MSSILDSLDYKKSFFSPLSTIDSLAPKKSLYKGYITDMYGEKKYAPGIIAKPISFQDDIFTIKQKYGDTLNDIMLEGVEIKKIEHPINRHMALLIFLIDNIGNSENYSYVDIIKYMLTKTQVLKNIDAVYHYLMDLETLDELNKQFSRTENFLKLQLFSMILQKVEYQHIGISENDIVLNFISKNRETEFSENIIFDLLFDLLYCEDSSSSDDESDNDENSSSEEESDNDENSSYDKENYNDENCSSRETSYSNEICNYSMSFVDLSLPTLIDRYLN